MVDMLTRDWSKADWTREETPLLLAADAVILHASLHNDLSAEAMRREVLRSGIRMEGLKWRELARYVQMTSNPSDWTR